MKHVYLTWHETEELVTNLVFKLNTPYDAILAITRGGIIPGGMIAEALKMKDVLTASLLFTDNPGQLTLNWPRFLQFPPDSLLEGRKILVIDNLWNRGRTILAAKGRIEAAGGFGDAAHGADAPVGDGHVERARRGAAAVDHGGGADDSVMHAEVLGGGPVPANSTHRPGR